MRIRTAFTAAAAVLLLGTGVANATLLLHYDFDEAASGDIPALDHGTGIPAPGTFEGGATRTGNTPGPLSLAALDLTNDDPDTFAHVLGGDADKLDGLGAFTLVTWLNLQDDPGGGRRLLAKQAAGTFDGFNWSIHNSPATPFDPFPADNFHMALFNGGSGGFHVGYSTASTGADDEWRFLAVTYDGASGDTNFYTGSPTDPVTQLGGTVIIPAGTTNPSNALFGVGYTDAAPTANVSPPGFLDDVRIYDEVLSAAELEEVRLAVIPEPASMALLALGLAAVAFGRRRQRG